MKLKGFLTIYILLISCEISLQGLTHLLAKKFVGMKLFKKMKALDKCELVWENIEHPHCETSWDRHCTPVTRTECDTEYIQKCIQEVERKCRTDQIEQCETKHVEFCETEAVQKCVDTVDTKCETEDVEECWEEDEQDCKTKKECGTKLDKVCSTIKKWACDKPKAEPEPEPEPESEPESEPHHSFEPEPEPNMHRRGTSVFTNPIKKVIKRSVDARIVRNVEEEMMDRFEKMSMRSLLELTDQMTEQDFVEEAEDEELERKLKVRAKRSLSLMAGAFGLSALYKKFLSTQDDCRQLDVPLCAEVPVETCYDVRSCQVKKVPKCRNVPTEVCHEVLGEDCWTEPEQTCWTEPREKCWDVPNEQCWNEPKERCWKEPEENCWQVDDEECEDIPSEHCEAVNVKVARRTCKEEPSITGH